MLFYRINAVAELERKTKSDEERTGRIIYRGDDEDVSILCNTISDEADRMYAEGNKKCFIFLKNNLELRSNNDQFKKIQLNMIAISESLQEMMGCLDKLKLLVSYDLTDISIEETTFDIFSNGLRFRNYTNADYDSILGDFNISDVGSREIKVKEYLMNKEHKTFAEYEQEARKYLCDTTLLPELKRIFAGKCQGSEHLSGIPVQYMICIKNREVREDVIALLRDALIDAERFENSRLYKMTYKSPGLFGPSDEDVIGATWSQLKVCKGSLVEFEYLRGEAADNENVKHKHAGDAVVEALGDCIKYYRNEVQTFLCLPGEFPGIERVIMERLGNVPVVKIKEEAVKGERAKEHLSMLAKEAGLVADEKLFAEVNDATGSFNASDMKVIFDRWHNDYIRTKVYSGYANVITAESELAKKTPEGCAYERLSKMTGLTGAKKVIDNALDFYKAQNIFKDKGMKNDRPAMHMVFKGNPGTAKTTVARLFAKILKENDILSKGELYELSRADLVGKYVGWTAPIVKRKFEEAKGSVLFIDEAYSLVDGQSGMYGDEAINTIVAEMENNREDMVVIFAGYPEEMDGFLEKNPGLRSRIAFHVPFEDYSASELYDIAGIIAEDKGIRLDESVKDKLIPIFDKALAQKDFGNGRFVRNMIEKAQMQHAARLVHENPANVTKDDCETLTAADFAEPEGLKETGVKIGFAV